MRLTLDLAKFQGLLLIVQGLFSIFILPMNFIYLVFGEFDRYT